ncbi:hypothetical protein I4U23_019517 [Adineta vaga]|nr:hypothetical protein I4U23_019517 [Adineta vaga]
MSSGTSLILIAVILSILGIIFNFILILFFLNYGKFTKYSTKTNGRRVGLLHSINTYIHLIGILVTLLLMCIQTLRRDLYENKYKENHVPQYCHFLAYLMPLFASGIYGSCFLQALFRFWRIMLPKRKVFQNLYFHILLIIFHWITIILLLLPSFYYSVYIESDHICLIPFDRILPAIYIACMTVIIPVTGLFILYMKLILYIKHLSQNRKRLKSIKRDALLVRRIFLLVIIIVQTSSAGIILWIVTLIDQRFLSLFYRLLRFTIILSMILCSIALFYDHPN